MYIRKIILKILDVLIKPFYVLIVRTICPIRNNVIVLNSLPDYSDNARAISEYLVNNGYASKYKIYWAVTNPEACRIKYGEEHLKFLPLSNTDFSFLKALRIFMTAGYVMGTHANFIPLKYFRKNQVIIRLWHGCSYKDKTKTDGIHPVIFKYACVSGPLFVEPKAYFWNCDCDKILPTGFARYDWLIHQKKEADDMYNYYAKGKEKIIIWMPTFRKDKKGRYGSYEGESSFPLLQNMRDWSNLDKACEQFNIRILVKMHMYQEKYDIDFSSFHHISFITNDDFDKFNISMYEFIAKTDALISDYSSIAIDYLLLDKPIGFVLDDFDKYSDKRGFIFKERTLDYMPGAHIYSIGDLTNFINDVSSGVDRHKSWRASMRGKAITLSENYCKDILSVMGI